MSVGKLLKILHLIRRSLMAAVVIGWLDCSSSLSDEASLWALHVAGPQVLGAREWSYLFVFPIKLNSLFFYLQCQLSGHCPVSAGLKATVFFSSKHLFTVEAKVSRNHHQFIRSPTSSRKIKYILDWDITIIYRRKCFLCCSSKYRGVFWDPLACGTPGGRLYRLCGNPPLNIRIRAVQF